MKSPTYCFLSILALSVCWALPGRAVDPEDLRQLLDTQRCQGCDLRGANLEGVDLRSADLTEAQLQGANLRNADLKYSNFRGANLTNAVMIAADLEAVNFSDAVLRNADVRGANLTDAVLTRANTCGWRRDGARLEGANLQDARCVPDRPEPQPRPRPTPEIRPTEETAPPLSQSDAVKLIEDWYAAKEKIFAPPFDRESVLQLTTGVLLTDALQAMNWLRENNAFYKYGIRRVESVDRFVREGFKGTLELTVTEEYSLYENNRINPDRSRFETKDLRYFLEVVDGRWKIADYEEID